MQSMQSATHGTTPSKACHTDHASGVAAAGAHAHRVPAELRHGPWGEDRREEEQLGVIVLKGAVGNKVQGGVAAREQEGVTA